MKKSHKLENGTLLEVGKKYTHKIWGKTYWHKVLSLGEKLVFTIDSDGNKSAEPYPKELIPYPKEKDLEGLELCVELWNNGSEVWKIEPVFLTKEKIEKSENIITLEEAKQRGLNLKGLGI